MDQCKVKVTTKYKDFPKGEGGVVEILEDLGSMRNG
jgi:hypothetical protein